MATSFTCPSCLLEVVVIQSNTGLCQACTEKQLETSRHTISAENPTASFQAEAVVEGAIIDNGNADSAKKRKVMMPLGYVDEQFVDEGGMGMVFRALELSTGRTVAIKMLHARKMSEDLIARFAVEAKALAALRHPNVVFLYEFKEQAKPPYLVMEYVDGTSAYTQLKEKTRFEPNAAARVIMQAAKGVHAAHLNNLIHRDIKPSNLLIDRQGVVKLTDFGLAKRLNVSDDLTMHGGIAGGTPGYMAPEQVNPKLGEFTVATDIWGLGATLYALLTGRPPYPSSRNEVLAVLSKNHKPVRVLCPEVSPVLEAIVQKCLAFDQADRYASAEDLASDLNNYLLKRPTRVRPANWVGRLWNTVRSLQTATVVAWSLALLVLTIIGAGFFTKRDQQPVMITDETLRQAYYEDCRKQLRDGKTVTLIGEDGAGPPKHVQWPFEDYQFSKPYARSHGATHLVANQNCFAQLLDDPGIDSYTLRGEFLHLGAAMIDTTKLNGDMPINSVVGLGFGLHRLKRSSGLECDSFMTFTYQDGWPFQDPTATKTMTSAKLVIQNVQHKVNFDKSPLMSTLLFAAMEYQPTDRTQQLWRTLEVRITPDDLIPSMTVTQDVMGTMHNRYSTSRSKQYIQQLNHGLKTSSQKPNDSYLNLAWNPKRPVGIWCQQSTVAVRNVQIFPDLPIQK